jgi:hypothetical protein
MPIVKISDDQMSRPACRGHSECELTLKLPWEKLIHGTDFGSRFGISNPRRLKCRSGMARALLFGKLAQHLVPR